MFFHLRHSRSNATDLSWGLGIFAFAVYSNARDNVEQTMGTAATVWWPPRCLRELLPSRSGHNRKALRRIESTSKRWQRYIVSLRVPYPLNSYQTRRTKRRICIRVCMYVYTLSTLRRICMCVHVPWKWKLEKKAFNWWNSRATKCINVLPFTFEIVTSPRFHCNFPSTFILVFSKKKYGWAKIIDIL